MNPDAKTGVSQGSNRVETMEDNFACGQDGLGPCRAWHSGRQPFVIAAEFVNRIVPARSLMPSGCLHDGQRSIVDAWAVVDKRADELRYPGKPLLRQKSRDFQLGVRPRLN